MENIELDNFGDQQTQIFEDQQAEEETEFQDDNNDDLTIDNIPDQDSFNQNAEANKKNPPN